MPLILKTVPAARGPRWIGDAVQLYLKRPLAFTLLFAVFLCAALVATWIPVLGALLQMMSLPLLSLGFMVAGQSALLGGPVHASQFIEPLRGDPVRRKSLLLLCLLYGVAAVAILLLCDAVSDGAMGRLQTLMSKGDPAPTEVDMILAEPGVSAAVLLGAALGGALAVPFWHAPALVHWGGQKVAQSLFSSTLAVWRCKGAFLAYSLAWFGMVLLFGVVTALFFGILGAGQFAGVAALPAGMLFSTVFYISLLFTFNDSFGGAAAVLSEPTPQNPAS